MTKVTLQPEKELFSSGSTVRSLSTKSFGFPDHNLNVASYGYIWDNQMISPKPVKSFWKLLESLKTIDLSLLHR